MEFIFQVTNNYSTRFAQPTSNSDHNLLDELRNEFLPKVFQDLKQDICPECNSEDMIDSDDLIICRNCAQVISRPFDNSAEYRVYSSEDRGCDPTRVGAPADPRLPEASLGTIILGGRGGGGGGGASAAASRAKNMNRVRKYHTWNSVPYHERSLMVSYEQLTIVATNHGINHSAVEVAKDIYLKLQSADRRQGLCRAAILSSCMYLSLKQLGSPRKPKEIAEIFCVSSATFAKALKQTQEILALLDQRNGGNPVISKSEKASAGSTNATEYIDLPISRLPIGRRQMQILQEICRQVATIVEEEGLSQENMPPSLAAGCIAFVLRRSEDIDISCEKIAEVSGISVATMMKCLKRLEQFSERLEAVWKNPSSKTITAAHQDK
ncbi:MAG: transcription initiation factor IIB family protein [Actinobacteria bacterium]|nr:transcription initiation factor IIB family protein [Actinomycetota bacterium]